MMKVSLEAPWYTYQKKIKALFERDPEITVGDVNEVEGGEINYGFNLEVKSHEKFVALDRILPAKKKFGNVVLGINLVDLEKTAANPGIDLYKAVFKGNPIVKDFQETTDQAGVVHSYVRFWPEVIQFFDDDLSDFNGNWSGLAQDIAREVFSADSWGTNFCTADLRENE